MLMCDLCFSAEATANMSASEETLSWLLDIVENDPDPYVRSACHHSCSYSFWSVFQLLKN